MKFVILSGPKQIAQILPRGKSWVILLPAETEPFGSEKFDSFCKACDYLKAETAAVSCRVNGFDLVKIQN